MIQKEKKKKGSKGCLKFGLLGFVIFLIVGIISMFMLNNLYKDTGKTSKLTDLLNRAYEPFINKVTEVDVANFHTKVTTNLNTKNGVPLVVNEKLVLAEFFSDNIILVNDVIFDKNDLSVLTNYVLNNNKSLQADLVPYLQLFSLDMQSRENDTILDYVAVLQVNVEKVFGPIGLNLSKLPSKMFITLTASYSLTAPIDKCIINSALQVNRLIGDDNTYVVNELLSLFDRDKSYINFVAKKPFDVLRYVVNKWQVLFGIENSQFVFSYKRT